MIPSSSPRTSFAGMTRCPAFVLTFLNDDLFDTDLVDSNSGVHYVIRTPSAASSSSSSARRSTSPGKRRGSINVQYRPSLLRRGVTRNPTIIVRPKSSSSEAKIVASLQWHRWDDSVFTTRWQVVRLDKMIRLTDDEPDGDEPDSEWSRDVQTSKGTWRWCARSESRLELLDAHGHPMARFDERHSDSSLSTPVNTPVSSLSQLRVEFKALDMLDLIVTSLLTVVHERQQLDAMFRSSESVESVEDGLDAELDAPVHLTSAERVAQR